MRTYFVFFGLLGLFLLGVACAPLNAPGSNTPAPPPTPTLSGLPQVTTTPVRVPPNIPFDHAARTQCFACHTTGVDGASPLPQADPDHRQFADDRAVCERCHPVVH